jgi:hypothetical protein
MGVGEFDTKVAVVVRDDLQTWQRLNVTAFLISGVTSRAGPETIGKDYVDGDGQVYLPLLVQTLRERAQRRQVPIAIYTAPMFETGNDTDNRAVVRAAATAELDLVGLAVRARHRDADAILRGVKRHP